MKILAVALALPVAFAFSACGDEIDANLDGADTTIEQAARGGGGGGGGKPPKEDPAVCDSELSACRTNCADTCGGYSRCSTLASIDDCFCVCKTSCSNEWVVCNR